MNKLDIDNMKKLGLIIEKNGKYYSSCVYDEEITIEIKELIKNNKKKINF